jgi:2-dehydropantoate 2-reductase
MMGFVFAGGKRDGSVIRAIQTGMAPSPFGEISGAKTPRLMRLVAILRQAGFNAETSTDISDWLATHATLVASIANLTIKYGCDTHSLARCAPDLGLLVDAMRETLDVLRACGRRIIPPRMVLIKIIPRFLLVALLRLLFASKKGEIGIAWHCSQAPDEMRHLGTELEVLVEKSGLPAPAIRKVLAPD